MIFTGAAPTISMAYLQAGKLAEEMNVNRSGSRGLIRAAVVVLLIAVVLAAAGVGLYVYARPLVTVTEVVQGPLVQAFYSTGTIQPEREYPIKSATNGTLSQVHVDKGDHVSKGQPLAVVTDPALIFTADRTKAELEEKQRRADEKTSPVLAEYDARLKGTQELQEIAQREVTRIMTMMENNAGSQTDLDRAMDRVKQLLIEAESIKAQRAAKKLELEREVEVAKSALNIAQWNLEEQTLKSPIDGVVLDRPTPLRTRVAINDSIMRIADVKPENLVLRADVDEEDIAKVSVKQPVRMTLYAFPGRVFNGKVTRIYDQADPSRRTFEVDVHFDEPNDRLQPGMTGELAFIMSSKEATLVIPSQALHGGSVFVVREGNKLEKVSPDVGLRSIERIEIIDGLPAGTRVVISPTDNLSADQTVRTKYMDPAEAAGLNKPPPITEAFKGF
jgi:multidrug efflux pump subunit AcrA (membrane-fusion protein)